MRHRFVNPYSNLSRIIIFTPLIILPFVFWPYYPVPYEVTRVIFFQRLVEVLAIIGLVKINTVSAKKFNPHIFNTLLFWVIVSVVASYFGADWIKSLWGNYYRLDGLQTLFHLVGLAIIVMLFGHQSWSRIIISSSALGSLFISLWAIIEKTGTTWGLLTGSFTWGENVALSFGNPNFLAGYLAVSLPALFYLHSTNKNRHQKLILLLAILIQFSATILTGSISGLIGTVTAVAAWSWFRQKRLRIIIILSAIFAITLLFANWFRSYQVTGFVAEGRERIIRNLVIAIGQRPLLGYGVSNVDYAFDAGNWPLEISHDVYVDKAHSILLEIVVTTGLVGLAIYFMLLFVVFRSTNRILASKKHRVVGIWLTTTLIVYLVHSQLNVISIMEEIYFWLAIGLVAGGQYQLVNKVRR